MSSKAIEENILKARKAFFASGCLGAFQGQLNPLSGRSIYVTCVLPVLLYGCENWIVNKALLDQLECFQAWVGKRILGISKCHNNIIVPIALDLPCVRSLVLLKKLRFLGKLMSDDVGTNCPLSKDLFATLAMRDIYNISIVSQCLYLEDSLELNCTTQCLEQPSNASQILLSCAEDIYASGKRVAIQKANMVSNLKYFMVIENKYPWMKLWDWALDYGVKGTKACQLTLRLLTFRSFSQTCHICNGALDEVDDSIFLEHALSNHFPVAPFSVPELCDAIGSENLFTYSKILFLKF